MSKTESKNSTRQWNSSDKSVFKQKTKNIGKYVIKFSSSYERVSDYITKLHLNERFQQNYSEKKKLLSLVRLYDRQ